jgi:anti-sigma B factor antagonist
MQIQITITPYKRCNLVKMAGRVDTLTAPKLQEKLNKIMEGGRYKIIFDMTEVDFLSSKGLWVLTETQKACKRYNRGELVLVGVDQKIRDSFAMVGMSDYFRTFDNVTDAVGNF